MTTTEKLGRFGHHPDPTDDFLIEVESISNEWWNMRHGFTNGTPKREALEARVFRAMTAGPFITERCLNAKHILRGIEREMKPSPAPEDKPMTILEDIKAGRLVVVPPVSVKPLEWSAPDKEGAVSAMAGPAIADVWPDCGRWYWRLGDVASGGGEVSEDAAKRMLWATYEARVLSALTASPGHTAGLIALVEGMERERDEARGERDRIDSMLFTMERRAREAMTAAGAAEARALAAEAERDALREVLAGAIAAFPHIRDEQTQKALNVLRALTEKNNG